MPRNRKKRISRHLKMSLPPREAAPGEGPGPEINLIHFTELSFTEKRLSSLEDLPEFLEEGGTAWIDITGLNDNALLRDTAERFGIHPLVLEDICNTGQRAKSEDYGNYQYTVLKMVTWDEESMQVEVEQVSMVLFPKVLITFQERPGDLFEPVRQRLRKGKGRLRKEGADYLAYSLLDAIVDGYFLLLEKIGDQVEVLEGELLSAPETGTSARLHELRREMIFLRKAAWPLREAVASLGRSGPLSGGTTAVYMRDLYDHVIQVIDGIETIRDILSGMLDIYLSTVSNRMNEIMKVLTVIATIFIPLTFIAGVYGMNFALMPELRWKWGYPAVLAVMAGTALWMLAFFRRKGWL